MGSAIGAAKARARMLALGLIGGPGLLEMRAQTPPGRCPFCLDPCRLKKSTKRLSGPPYFATCGGPECLTAYMRTYGRDRRAGRLRRGTLIALRKNGPQGPLVAVCNTRPSTVTFDPVEGRG